jgi:hypothetical protein
MAIGDSSHAQVVNRRFAAVGCAALGAFSCSLLGTIATSSICFFPDDDQDLTCTVGSLSGLLFFIVAFAIIVWVVLIFILVTAHPDSLDDFRPATTRSLIGIILGNGLGIVIASSTLAVPHSILGNLLLPLAAGLVASAVEYVCIDPATPQAWFWLGMGGGCWLVLALLLQITSKEQLWLLLVIGITFGLLTTIRQWRFLGTPNTRRRIWLISRCIIWSMGWSVLWLLLASYCFYWRSCAVNY